MVNLRRVAWPQRVVWKENDNFLHHRFYWLQRSPEANNPDTVYAAHVDGQTIAIEAPASGQLVLRLSDDLLNLDKHVRVVAAGKTIFEGKVERSLATMLGSLQERPDSSSVATALLPVTWTN
jgi:hypothetical protein